MRVLEEGVSKKFIVKDFRELKRVDQELNKGQIKLLKPLSKNFGALDEVLEIHNQARAFERDLKKVFRDLNLEDKPLSDSSEQDSN